MIPVLIEASLLSFIAETVVNDLHKLRIRDGFGRKRALTSLQSIAIPRLPLIQHRLPEADACIPLSAQPMTLLEELQSILLAKSRSATESGPFEAHIAAAISAQTEEPVFSPLNTAPDPLAIEPDSSTTEGR
jgi:hypothetical protein